MEPVLPKIDEEATRQMAEIWRQHTDPMERKKKQMLKKREKIIQDNRYN